MLMRIALGVHFPCLEDVFESYHLMSKGAFTHATPTMYNAGTRSPTLASCYLLPIVDDSVSGIYETVKRCATISKGAGGVGISVSNVRANGSLIRSTGGRSSGIVPMLRSFDMTARHIDQGGGKRKGAFAIYLEPWHPDVRSFLDMKKNSGAEEFRARDLFYALWIPNLFMKRVQEGGKWSLFCPSRCPDLVDLHGDDFERRYIEYESTDGVAVSVISAQELWFAILDSQIETGTPYMLYKDACNSKSNHRHLGTIRSSNLCTEVVQYSSSEETSVCNLASISLPFFVKKKGEGNIVMFDFESLQNIVAVVVKGLNRVIDRTQYVSEEAHRSNSLHRPFGIGVQGLADTFAMMRYAFDSPEAAELNRDIFETIYYSAVSESCRMSKRDGPYTSFSGSPMSNGILQFDMWDNKPPSSRRIPPEKWDTLRKEVVQFGVRNSLMVAPMPTASTAQILGNNECFEPFTSNIYSRRVLSGEFAIMNRHLVRELEEVGLWDEDMRLSIIASNGSVSGIERIPPEIRGRFKTVWEMSMRTIIDMAAERAPYIDQSQSMNLFVSDPTHSKLTSMHFHSWKRGLKAGMYYLRTRSATDAVKVTVPVEHCRRGGDPGECESCSA